MWHVVDNRTILSLLTGSNHVYYFVNPLKPAAPEETPKEITWEYAQKEVAEAKGFAIGLVGLTKGTTGKRFFHICYLQL